MTNCPDLLIGFIQLTILVQSNFCAFLSASRDSEYPRRRFSLVTQRPLQLWGGALREQKTNRHPLFLGGSHNAVFFAAVSEDEI